MDGVWDFPQIHFGSKIGWWRPLPLMLFSLSRVYERQEASFLFLVHFERNNMWFCSSSRNLQQDLFILAWAFWSYLILITAGRQHTPEHADRNATSDALLFYKVVVANTLVWTDWTVTCRSQWPHTFIVAIILRLGGSISSNLTSSTSSSSMFAIVSCLPSEQKRYQTQLL